MKLRCAILDDYQNVLLLALENKWIAGAGLDVFTTEPLPANDKLRSLSNVLATPHLGSVSAMNYQVYFGEAVENIKAYLAGKPIRVFPK